VTLSASLKKQALGLSQKAMEKLLEDERRAAKVAQAFGQVQKGREALRKGQDDLMHAFSFATKSDYKAVGKTLASLKRRVRELEEKIDALTRT
jgi:hypothetical protein